ncbi:uncharacterized protein LOC144159549 [Haemaphysalis longicornis]
MKQAMQGPLLVLLANFFCYAPTTVLGSEQHTIPGLVFAPGKGTIRLGRFCDTSIDCVSGCCLYNKTAGIGRCERLEQRYSGCSPRRPKGLEGTLLDVYIHFCPCQPHLRCAKEHKWHVCLKRKPHLGQGKPTEPPGGEGVKPPVKPPSIHPGLGTYNGTLRLGDPCGTSIDCESGCCLYNPRVGFSYCHMQQQIYDDCSPWHPKEEKGTLVDVYFRHCPCNKQLRCTKENKKWHICRKRPSQIEPGTPSEQAPAQQPEGQTPQLETPKLPGGHVLEETAVGNPEAHGANTENTTQSPSPKKPVQKAEGQKPQLETPKPSGGHVLEETAVGNPEVHEAKTENKTESASPQTPAKKATVENKKQTQEQQTGDGDSQEDEPITKNKPLAVKVAGE